MAEECKQKQPAAAPFKPTITLPPRPTADHLFGGGGSASPGPLTLVSSFFADGYPETNSGSFSQLLAGAMNSPLAVVTSNTSDRIRNAPMSFGVMRSPLFTVPPGLSPSGLLNSPQSPFGMSHQLALAQVTAQAALFQPDVHGLAEVQPSKELFPNNLALVLSESTQQPIAGPSASESTNAVRESSEITQANRNYLPPMVSVDKPSEDGYNWRKYGQKQVKGCEFPRSYYKCTHLNCPVKKKVEQSLDGRITEIIYKGQHNHEMPQPNRRPKEANGSAGLDQTEILNQKSRNQPLHAVPGGDQETLPASTMHPHRANDNVEANHTETKVEDSDDDHEPNLKRRNVEVGAVEAFASHKTVTEPKIVVQTRSEVDLLDDGYRWRKYGQKIVKGNPHPRSYYKCTFPRCNVRKHVERAAADPKAVITTYEGKHNHDVPAARQSSHTMANPDVHLVRPQKVTAEKHPLLKGMDLSHDQMPAALRLKEEKVTG